MPRPTMLKASETFSQTLPEESLTLVLGFFPNITFRGFTLGWVYSQQNRGRIKSENADYELAERTDSGPLMALNLSLFGGVLKFGVTGMILTRKQIIKDIPENQPTSIDEDVDFKKGDNDAFDGGNENHASRSFCFRLLVLCTETQRQESGTAQS